MTIRVDDVHWSVAGKAILRGVSLDVAPGCLLGLLGPNGSGKSSLLRLMAGLRRPTAGAVTLDGVSLQHVTRREVARRIAFVEQHAITEAPVTVLDIVRLGRTPHRGALSGWTGTDDAAVESALAQTDLSGKRHQRWATLSGGERQRAQIARALAQSPRELLLDEPTNHLDIRHQLDILMLLKRLQLTAVVALHDLNLAAMFCDTVAILHAGKLVAAGAPEQILTEATLREVFGVDAMIRSRADRTLQIEFSRPQ